MKIEHSLKQVDYVVLQNQRLGFKRTKCERENVFERHIKINWFQTVSDVKLRYYGKIFYKDGKKIIPNNISKLLTPVSMAVWFMDDGSIKSKHHKTLLINTQSFSRKEIEFLQKAIEQKFQILSFTQAERRLADRISRSRRYKISKIIEPTLQDSMKYKIDPID